MKVTIIADASWCPDTHMGGYGFWIAGERGKLGGGGRLCRSQPVINATAAEMMALCNALYAAFKHELIHFGDEVLLQTDCLAAINIFKGIGTPLSEQEEQALATLQTQRNMFELDFEFRHVKGHTSNPNARSVTNRLCDERAKKFMREARAEIRTKHIFDGTSVGGA